VSTDLVHLLVLSHTGRPRVACGAPGAERAACELSAVTCPECRRTAAVQVDGIRPLARAREADLLRDTVALAQQYGWLVYHTYRSTRSAKGFPDVVAVRAGSPVLCLELKSATGRVTPEQQQWIDTLQQTKGTIAAVVRPQDMQQVVAWLTGRDAL
jgi:hypothetical protein